jgi:hypothetical protein
MSEPRALVEHFFRHEFGRLVAVLTRSLGVRRLALVEDVVQAALVQALEIWSRRGVPEDPAAAGFTAPPATWRSTRCGGSEPRPGIAAGACNYASSRDNVAQHEDCV